MVNLSGEATDLLVDILAEQAATHFAGPVLFYRDLINRTTLPSRYKLQLAGGWAGDPLMDARRLIRWAEAKGVNPADGRYTTLGSLLTALLEDLGLGNANKVVAVIVAYDLYLDDDLLESLRMRYQVPIAAMEFDPAAMPFETTKGMLEPEFGPEITWSGPTDELTLQGWLKPEPDFQDVGFLMRAIDRTASVCRVEIDPLARRGTGFLVADGLVMTNYHVLRYEPGEDIEANARATALRFGCVTAEDGRESLGQTFTLDEDEPILAASPVDELDYVLLRVEPKIKQDPNIKPLPFSEQEPIPKADLHILQHPQGQAMKIALSNNGVTYVDTDKGLVQYWTRALGGSSGAPCFNHDWDVVALHHAERAVGLGVRREGILFKAIHKEIGEYI